MYAYYYMKIDILNSKCVYCSQLLNTKSKNNYHTSCKNEVDQFQSIYGLKNPWIQLWINLLVKNLSINFDTLNFNYIFSIQDLFVEIREFTNYKIGSGFIFENLCFIRFKNPTWICLKENTAIDANNFQDWEEKEFIRMVKNFTYNSPDTIRQYTSNPLLQLYFPSLH